MTVIIDFIHVIEYLWAAAWCFFDEGEPAAETWVAHHARRILAGHARPVAIARKARHLQRSGPTKADACVTYLRSNAAHLDYATALANGWPIATGIIEGLPTPHQRPTRHHRRGWACDRCPEDQQSRR